MKIPFHRIWSESNYELKNWLFHNFFIGLSPVWLSCVFLMFGKVFSQFLTPFLDGRLLIFTATLSGASMSFFATETKLNLRQTERFIFNGLLAAVFLGAGGYTAIVTMEQFSPKTLWSPMVFAITLITLGLATYFNLYLAGVRSVYADTELMEKLREEEISNEKAILVEKAHAAQEVDGVKL